MADYKTISSIAQGLYKEKGSKFLAFVCPISSEREAKYLVDKYKTDYPAARHHCYAYRLEPLGEKFRSYDDGEPSGTAGKPILNQLLANEITNTIAIVVRYSGGTKLGVSGLITAYKKATIEAIRESTIIDKYIRNVYNVSFSYAEMPIIMKWIKKHRISIIKQDLNLNCQLEIEVRKIESEAVLNTCPRNIIPKLLYTI